MCETESGWGEWKELGWEIKMGGRLDVWMDVLLVWKGKIIELGACDGNLLGL